MNKLASQIDSLNKHLIGSLHTSYPFGLAHGKMGLLIYLYHLYDYTQEAIYKEKAERLLDDLLENDLSKNAELTVGGRFMRSCVRIGLYCKKAICRR